jgi:ubiquinone/menaquinone biosynthesis C-methylase UbiE
VDAAHPNPLDDAARERWLAKQAHYQDGGVVEAYDARRFRGWRARGSTERKWNAIRREIGPELGIGSIVLDVPCGRGRFTSRILAAGSTLVSADLSRPMLAAAVDEAATCEASESEGAGREARARFHGPAQCDASRLPFADGTFDLVMSIRFLFPVPRALRPDILREMARVSKRVVVVDVRHRYCWTTHTKRLRAWVAGKRPPSERATISELDRLVTDAGLVLRKRVWIAPLLSEKMLLVCEKG